LLIALLALPFSLFAKVERMEGEFGYKIAIRYPWKFLGFGIGSGAGQQRMRILIGNRSVYEKAKRKGNKSEKKPKKDEPISTESENVSEKTKRKGNKLKKDKPKRKFSDFVQIGKLLRGHIKPIMQFLKDILRYFIKKAHIEGDLEVGVSDPALMGMLYGMYWSVLWNKQHSLKINPNFLDATFSGWIEFEVYITLLSILFAVIKLAFKVPIIKIIRMSKQRKKQNMEVN